MTVRSSRAITVEMSRNHSLDTMRGLAALAVAIGHSDLAVTGLPAWQATLFNLDHLSGSEILGRLLYLVFPSDAAVSLFFVLSGHVLWQSFQRSEQVWAEFPDYLVKRAYRLLPALGASCLVMAALTGTSIPKFLTNAILVDRDLIGVSWTLQVEAVCSIALFIVHRAAKGSTRTVVFLLAGVVAFALIFRGYNFLLFFPAFLLGALIDDFPPLFLRRSAIPIGFMIMACSTFILSRHAQGRFGEMAGATLLLGAVGRHRPRWTTVPALVLLGEISYSFYLAHPIAMNFAHPLLLSAAWIGVFPLFLLMAAVTVLIAFPIAWLLHAAIEKPMMVGRPRIPV